VLSRLASAAASAGRMPSQSDSPARVYQPLADVLSQLGKLEAAPPPPTSQLNPWRGHSCLPRRQSCRRTVRQEGGARTQPAALPDQPVVLGVASNPEPKHPIGNFDANCPMVQSDSGRPERTNSLEVERWIPRVCFQLGECSVCQLLNRGRKRPLCLPEFRRGVVIHSFVESPAS
jgi:hypothetical protein